MYRPLRLLCVLAMAIAFVAVKPDHVSAGYPVYYAPVQPVAPAVVGYTARRAGLFGRRVVVNPVVAPVAAPAVVPAPVVVARPVVPAGVYLPPPVVPAYRVPVAAYYPVW